MVTKHLIRHLSGKVLGDRRVHARHLFGIFFCVVVTVQGAELARYGKRHTSLRQRREIAELVGGGQWAEPRALRSAGVGSHDVAGHRTAILHFHLQEWRLLIL